MVFRTFDPVTVKLSLDSSNIQHEKIIFQLVEPYIKGFSVQATDEVTDSIHNTESNMIPAEKKQKMS